MQNSSVLGYFEINFLFFFILGNIYLIFSTYGKYFLAIFLPEYASIYTPDPIPTLNNGT